MHKVNKMLENEYVVYMGTKPRPVPIPLVCDGEESLST